MQMNHRVAEILGHRQFWNSAQDTLLPRCRRSWRLCVNASEQTFAHIEKCHAAVRRHLVTKSTQTWRLGLESASSELVFQSCRRIQNGCGGVSRKVRRKHTKVSLWGHTQHLLV